MEQIRKTCRRCGRKRYIKIMEEANSKLINVERYWMCNNREECKKWAKFKNK